MAILTVSITDFGAEPHREGGALQTDRIQAAIDHVFIEGGGEVVVPAGTFYTGSIRLRSNITLRLLDGAKLLGSRNPEDYYGWKNDTLEPVSEADIYDGPWGHRVAGKERELRFMRLPCTRWNNALIRALDAKNVAIIGEGSAEFDGADCFDELGEEDYRGPHGVDMFRCENVTFSGYTFRNSSNWAHSLFFCKNIEYSHVTVIAGHDGIHVTRCENVHISDSDFYTGDDCVAGFANVNVSVTNCELNTACSGMRFGGTNVFVRGCHFYGPAKYFFRGSLTREEKRSGAVPTAVHRYNMLSAFTYYADHTFDIPERPGNVIITDCVIENTDRLLHFNYSGNEPWQSNRPLESIRFENITASGISMPLTAYGDAAAPVSLTILNMSFSFREGFETVPFMHLCNYERLSITGLNVSNAPSAFIKLWPGITGPADIPSNCVICETTEPFVCKAI